MWFISSSARQLIYLITLQRGCLLAGVRSHPRPMTTLWRHATENKRTNPSPRRALSAAVTSCPVTGCRCYRLFSMQMMHDRPVFYIGLADRWNYCTALGGTHQSQHGARGRPRDLWKECGLWVQTLTISAAYAHSISWLSCWASHPRGFVSSLGGEGFRVTPVLWVWLGDGTNTDLKYDAIVGTDSVIVCLMIDWPALSFTVNLTWAKAHRWGGEYSQ